MQQRKKIACGVLFGGHHTYDEYGMIMMSRPHTGEPAPKTYSQDIPGADGALDLTEATTGEVKYSNRPIETKYLKMIPLEQQAAFKSRLMHDLHGKKLQVILDEDPNYYYYGRVSVTLDEAHHNRMYFTISVDAEPFKIDLADTLVEVNMDDQGPGYRYLWPDTSSNPTESVIMFGTGLTLKNAAYVIAELGSTVASGNKTIAVIGRSLSDPTQSETYSRSITAAEVTAGIVRIPVTDLTAAGVDITHVTEVDVHGIGGCKAGWQNMHEITLTVDGGDRTVVPEIYSSVAGVIVRSSPHADTQHRHYQRELAEGWQQIPAIAISGTTELTFIANQTGAEVKARFRAGWL